MYQNVSDTIRAKISRKRGSKGAILGENDRLGGISSSKRWYLISKRWYLVSKRWYLAKSGNRWYAYVSAIWVVCVVSPEEDFFSKCEFYGFSSIHCIICISLYQSCLYVYNIHNGMFFFLIILPRWIYNAVFFWRQYVKCIFFKKFWSDVLNVLNVWYSPMNTPLP